MVFRLLLILVASLGLPLAALAQGAPAAVGGPAAPVAAPPASGHDALAFYLVAALAAGSALGCVLATNIVRMAMCLLGTLGAVALLYFLLAATFLGVIQLVVYAGGTLIVIVFGVMLTSRAYWERLAPRRGEVLAGGLICVGLLAGLAAVLLTAAWPAGPAEPPGFSVAAIGRALLTTYLVPFELASVLLLAAMIGAGYLALPRK
jgi:NADH-quinone oxidoreductase subunit J